MIKKHFVIYLWLFFCTNVHAVMIRSSIDSFVDTDTDLEWMRFGVNNFYTFDETIALLASGRKYSDWRLATREEAYKLWLNAFFGKGAEFEVVIDEQFHFLSASDDSSNEANSDSIWEGVFDVMGYNHKYAANTYIEENQAQALFLNQDGTVGYVYFNDNKNSPTFGYQADDFVLMSSLYEDASDLRENDHPVYSTLLVRNIYIVSEPPILIFFGLFSFYIVNISLKRKLNFC
ncbi:hypothetical protein [Aliiglaciecola lipolytica]|uniref:hypothetical protein n=1 Tax=Aliiglaciecola lipolytica TaxID=477689 RepID=UPI001C09C135|nr:hypothetical protein [Aliiglaciecola lipolytica]MBU2877712.1 hypothetical protein [Aliiglaciecola lipolytica]